MKYDFDALVDRAGTYAAKVDALPAGSPADALSVWVADMDFPCAQPILDALHERIDRKILGYTLYPQELKDAIVSWYGSRYGWNISQEDLFFCPGVVPALALLINALTKEGDGIVIQRPVYYPFTNKIKGSGRTIYNNSLIYEDGAYHMDYEDLDKKLADPAVKGMIFCSPHNPVGRVWTQEELRRMVDIAKRYGKWIISDEIHMDLTRVGVVHTPLLKLAPDYAQNIIACTAPSKTFNLAGCQFSNIIIPNKDWQEKWKHLSNEVYSLSMPNPFGIAAALAAYTQGEDWLEQVRTYLDGNIRYIEAFVEQHLPKARVSKTEGTYLVWVDLNAYLSDPKALEHLMQNTARVAFDEGYIFGEEGNGFERINIATPRSVVEEVMRRMKMALDTL